MAKKASRKTIVNKLDTIFSKFIRLRVADREGIVECVTCGKKDHWRKMQAGHFMSRRHYATRWHEDNVQVQCPLCNCWGAGEQYKYAKFLGEDKSEELLALSRQTVKYSNDELLDMINVYKDKLEKL